ncbi:hypothetical protein [Pantoea vagans]|uniref:hypothetical protein n=1 Tax=Pantoea vagans TaxID=470934 RepID=UPI00301879B0
MTIHEIMQMRRKPRLGRVISVDLEVLRSGLGSEYGVIHDLDAIRPRKVRRVMDADGWRWQLVRQHKDQGSWDYYFESDRECLTEVNYDYGLMK